jgi:hypothetical protein
MMMHKSLLILVPQEVEQAIAAATPHRDLAIVKYISDKMLHYDRTEELDLPDLDSVDLLDAGLA